MDQEFVASVTKHVSGQRPGNALYAQLCIIYINIYLYKVLKPCRDFLLWFLSFEHLFLFLCLTFTFESSFWCTAQDMLEWRKITKPTQWWAKLSSQVACISEDQKCWGAWDITCRHKANDDTLLIACNIETVSKAMLGKFLRDWVLHIWAFLSA